MNYRILIISLLAATVLSACAAPAPALVPTATPTEMDEEAQVRILVETFGKRLQMVSLLAPDAAEQIQVQYDGLASPTLIEAWMEDPSRAPGRMVSSPWPDRIEITTLKSEAPGRYVIDGFVVEMTSTEVGSGGAADRIPVHIVVERGQENWLITEYAEER